MAFRYTIEVYTFEGELHGVQLVLKDRGKEIATIDADDIHEALRKLSVYFAESGR